MARNTASDDSTEIDEQALSCFIEHLIDMQNGDESAWNYAEYELAHGLVVWVDPIGSDEHSTDFDLLLTEEPHYLKRDVPDNIEDNGGEIEEIAQHVSDRIDSETDFEPFSWYWERNDVANTPGVFNYTLTCRNPLVE